MFKKTLSLVLIFSLVTFNNYVFALPQGENIENGDVAFDRPDDFTLNITASNQAIIGWQSFSIAANETVNFFQPLTSASVLNRVLGGSISEILGALNSNGLVILQNPSGINFGATAVVNVGSLIASTLNISNENFLAQNYSFEKDFSATAGSVINEGHLVAADGGSINLLGRSVENRGTIQAKLGSVNLAAGDKMTLSFGSNGLLAVAIDEGVQTAVLGSQVKDAVTNVGTIAAQGGSVKLSAEAVSQVFDHLVNQQGVIEAQAVANNNGTVELVGMSGDVVNSGTVNVNGTEENADGGSIDVKGGTITQAGTLSSNAADNGKAGDIHVISENGTNLTAGSKIEAHGAETNSEGGNIYINSLHGNTTFSRGSIVNVSGGTLSGDAGFAEVSGRTLEFGGRVLGSAAEGYEGGRLLVDPLNIIFNTTTQTAPTNSASPTADIAFNAAPGAGTTTVEIADIVGFAEARFEATNDITVDNPLVMNSGKDLVLSAGNNLNLNANVQVQGAGKMTLTADADFSAGGGAASDGVGTIVQAAGTSILGAAGAMTLSTGGNFIVRTITKSAAGVLSITSTAGSILDDGNAATKITSPSLTLTANTIGKGVGTTGALNTDINNLTFNVGNDGIQLHDVDKFSLTSATTTNHASVNLQADDDLTISGTGTINLDNEGAIALTADADNSGAGKLVMSTGSELKTKQGAIILSDAGNMDLRNIDTVGGDVTATSRGDVGVRSIQTQGGKITITADSENNGNGGFSQSSGTQLTTSGGDVVITGADNATIRAINAGAGDVSITGNSGSHIDDDGDNATKITADKLTLNAGGRIGVVGALSQLDSSVNELVATASGGNMNISNDKALLASSITVTGAGNDIDLTTTAGDLTAGTMNSSDDVNLTAAGSVLASGPASLITGNKANIVAGVNIGDAAQPLNLALSANDSTFDASLGSAHLQFTSATDINFSGTSSSASGVTTYVTPKGTIKLAETTGDLTLGVDGASLSAGNFNFVDGDLKLQATNNVNITGPITTTGTGAQTFTADSDNSGVGTFVQSPAADITAGDGTITISSAGDLILKTISNTGILDITSTNGGIFDNTTSLTTDHLSLDAETGIGTELLPLFVEANSLEATTNTGGIFIENNGNLAVNNSGVSVTGSGDIILSVNSDGVDNGDLDLQSLVTTANGDVLLSAEGAITDGNGAGVLNVSGNTVDFIAGGGGVDSDVNAATQLNAFGDGTVSLRNTSGDMKLGLIIAAEDNVLPATLHDVNLTSVGAITDTNAGDLNVIGDTVNLVANGGGIDTDVLADTQVNADSEGDIFLRAPESELNLGLINASGGSNDLYNVSLEAKKEILDANDGDTNVIGDHLSMTSDKSIGKIDEPINTMVNSLEAEAKKDGVFVSNTGDLLINESGIIGSDILVGLNVLAGNSENGNLVIDSAINVTGDVSLNAAGSITDANGQNLDITGHKIDLVSGGQIDLDVNALDKVNADSEGDINLNNPIEHLKLGLINGGNNNGDPQYNVTLNAKKTIINDAKSGDPNVIADHLNISAEKGIGAADDHVLVKVKTLEGTVKKGDIYLDSIQGDISVTGNGIEVTNEGNINLNVYKGGSGKGDLTLTKPVVTDKGAVNLYADGSIKSQGSDGKVEATLDSSFSAGKLIGSSSKAIPVKILGGGLSVSALTESSGVSVNVSGTVSPSNHLTVVGNPPGDVLFNGQDQN